MRTDLAKEEGQRKKFRAVFERLGKKTNYKGHREDTILLKNITDVQTNRVVTDHAWFSYTRGFEAVRLTEGVAIEFEARVKSYRKGYVNRRYGIDKERTDFKLSHPTKIRLVPPASA